MKRHTKAKQVFLAGGGSEVDSRLLDEQFVAILDPLKPVVYIPNAMASKRHPSCLQWVRSVLFPLGVQNIEMWNDLKPRANVSAIAGIYIGGGDTVKLLREIRRSGFDGYLKKMVATGIPVYGGSAGAIIFGEDIRTAPEARDIRINEARGLRIVSGYSIVCHYERSQGAEMRKISRERGCKIIAIPEKAGGYLHGKILENRGSKPITIFRNGKAVQLKPNGSTRLT